MVTVTSCHSSEVTPLHVILLAAVFLDTSQFPKQPLHNSYSCHKCLKH